MTPEQALRKCHEPLDLSPMARMEFTDRQARLIQWGTVDYEAGKPPGRRPWPCDGWYSDEDFCRAFNTAVQQADRADAAESRVKELEGENAKLCRDTASKLANVEAKYIEQLKRANYESAEHRQYATEYQKMWAKCDRLQARVKELEAENAKLLADLIASASAQTLAGQRAQITDLRGRVNHLEREAGLLQTVWPCGAAEAAMEEEA